MCHHPFCFARLPLSHPTTTLNVLLISWGSYCWGVECGRTISPFPHAHSTSKSNPTLGRKNDYTHHSTLSTTTLSTLPHFPTRRPPLSSILTQRDVRFLTWRILSMGSHVARRRVNFFCCRSRLLQGGICGSYMDLWSACMFFLMHGMGV